MNTPKPCPCCGCEANLRKKGKRSKYKYKYECSDCWTQTGWYWTVDEALQAWNKMETISPDPDADLYNDPRFYE